MSSSSCDVQNNNQRLRLGFRNLHELPSSYVLEPLNLLYLDVSYNYFDNVDFLANFPNLRSFIAHGNRIKSTIALPYMVLAFQPFPEPSQAQL